MRKSYHEKHTERNEIALSKRGGTRRRKRNNSRTTMVSEKGGCWQPKAEVEGAGKQLIEIIDIEKIT